ncbi:MAG: export transporter permease LptF, partial [Pseudomonadota bacterium]
NDPSTLTGISPRIIPTQDLFRIAEGRFQGELGWRLGMALAGINFMLLALASSRVNPRSGRSGGLIVALLFFVAYFNLLNFGKNWVATGKINMPMMLLVLHGGVFVASLLWLWKRHTQWSFGSMLHRRRARETEVPT